MGLETNARVIVHGFWRREQNQRRAAALGAGSPDQFAANALPLMRHAHGEIRKISRVAEIAETARNADQQVAVPGGHHQIRIAQH